MGLDGNFRHYSCRKNVGWRTKPALTLVRIFRRSSQDKGREGGLDLHATEWAEEERHKKAETPKVQVLSLGARSRVFLQPEQPAIGTNSNHILVGAFEERMETM